MMRRESAPKQRTALRKGNRYIYLNIFYVLSRFKELLPKLLEKVSAEGKKFFGLDHRILTSELDAKPDG